MQTVYKYTFELDDFVKIEMPRGAEFLHVAEQAGVLCIWARVYSDSTFKSVRTLRVAGTGHPLEDGSNYRYVGTITQVRERGTFV